MGSPDDSLDGAVRRLEELGHGALKPPAASLAAVPAPPIKFGPNGKPRVTTPPSRGLSRPGATAAAPANAEPAVRAMSAALTLVKPSPVANKPSASTLPAPMTSAQRMKELEELAELACSENERLERENDRLRHDADKLFAENEALHKRIAVLENSVPEASAGSAPSSLAAPIGPFGPPVEQSLVTPTEDLRRRSGGLLQSLSAFTIAVLLIGGVGFVGLALLGAGTELRWSRTGFTPAQLRVGFGVARKQLALSLAPHPRYGRGVALPMPTLAIAPAAPSPAAAERFYGPMPEPLAAPGAHETQPTSVAPSASPAKAPPLRLRKKVAPRPTARATPIRPTGSDPLSGLQL